MNANYESLKAHNPILSGLLWQADSFLKTFPDKAAILYEKAMRTFMMAVCADNNIRFMRPRDLTTINMLGSCFAYGIISKYEKAVLDDIRYAAHLASHPELSYKPQSTAELTEKVIAFYEVVSHYYQLPQNPWQADAPSIDSYEIETVLGEFDMQSAYDKLYLGKNASGRYALIAQYQRGLSPAADEAFTYLAETNIDQMFIKHKRIVVPKRIETLSADTYVFTKSVVPQGFEPFDLNKLANYPTKRRMDIVYNLSKLLCALHFNKKPLAIGGISAQDLWLNGCEVCLSGLERSFGIGGYLYDSPISLKTAQKKDRESLAQLIRQLLPEYERISALFHTVRNILLGSERILMDNVLEVVKNEMRHYRTGEWTLSEYPRDIEAEEALLYLRTQSEDIKEDKPILSEEQKEKNEEQYREMFDRIFR